MSRLRFRIAMSLDGFVAGPAQGVENPIGVGGMRLHEWVFPLRAWRATHGMPGGEVNESNRVVEESMAGIGATIMGRNMFGGAPGPWDPKKPWNGWWGSNPPYHHPVFGERLFENVGDELHGLELVGTVVAPNVTHVKCARP